MPRGIPGSGKPKPPKSPKGSNGTHGAAVAVLEELAPVTAGSQILHDARKPYVIKVEINGTAPMIFHAWNTEVNETKSESAHGSTIRKTDDLESMVYRDPDSGDLSVPCDNILAALVAASKMLKDPRSPRKSLADITKAGIVVTSTKGGTHCSVGVKAWDYVFRCRARVQMQYITRSRPTMRKGWRLSFRIEVNLPEYLPFETMQRLVIDAGRFCGLCDQRPQYGRFGVTSFKTEKLT